MQYTVRDSKISVTQKDITAKQVSIEVCKLLLNTPQKKMNVSKLKSMRTCEKKIRYLITESVANKADS